MKLRFVPTSRRRDGVHYLRKLFKLFPDAHSNGLFLAFWGGYAP